MRRHRYDLAATAAGLLVATRDGHPLFTLDPAGDADALRQAIARLAYANHATGRRR